MCLQFSTLCSFSRTKMTSIIMMGCQVSLTLVVTLLFMSVQNIDGGRVPFKDYNKQPIISVEGKGGIYDCIERTKQPALDHPLLKDHKIQMKPTSLPKGSSNKASSMILEGVECPEGTVPIRRKEDLVRANKFNQGNDTMLGSLAALPGISRAMYASKLNDGSKFHGTQASMNVLNPRVAKDQSSFSLIRVETGDIGSGTYGSIQAGWTVSQNLYSDSKTRFVISWRSISQGKESGCFNHECSGFVQIDNSFPLDMVLTDISKYDGDTYEIQVSIFQDANTKDWWVTIPDKNIKIGYLPSTLIPSLAEGGDTVAWGGYTKASPDGISPEMGYGNFPDNNLKHSGYFIQVSVINDMNEKKEPYGAMGPAVINSHCYGVNYLKSSNPNDGYAVTYGGPGGKCF